MFIFSKYPGGPNKYRFFEVVVNPKILEISEEKTLKWEACLSDEQYIL